MRDRKTVIFPTLLFAIFFILITITGFLQINIVRNNLRSLLRGQGEILFNHVKREIDINLEYLDLLDKSPSIITPSFFKLIVYDEAIVEDLYRGLIELSLETLHETPLRNVLILDDRGKELGRKGEPRISGRYVQALIAGQQERFIKMPTPRDDTLVVGLRTGNMISFLAVDGTELDTLRKRFIVSETLETEGKRFDVSGITIYDERGDVYAMMGGKQKNSFLFTRALDSKFIPGHRMEVFLSRSIADEIFHQTTWNFVLILIILIFSGAISTYATFLLSRKYDAKVKEMEKEMEVKERLVSLGKLASGMAHEIRNPLNAISISVQRLKREFTPGNDKKDEYGKFIDIIRGELGRVDRIVEEFLLSTKSRAVYAVEDLHDLIDDVVALLQEKAALKNVELINNTENQLHVECQGERLKQAFYNIILNGIEAINDQGSVEISSARKGGHANITVRDTGAGIKEKDFHSIFEYYFTTKNKGIGLGLPISYLIVKDHGGDIKAFSEYGKGTKFTISLPFKQSRAGNTGM